ncbi:MAG: hypothetical protein M3O22_06105 [Pseudomonadota bacterium]|nr:hypothetical protein [Pseudomonadota bacterium]
MSEAGYTRVKISEEGYMFGPPNPDDLKKPAAPLPPPSFFWEFLIENQTSMKPLLGVLEKLGVPTSECDRIITSVDSKRNAPDRRNNNKLKSQRAAGSGKPGEFKGKEGSNPEQLKNPARRKSPGSDGPSGTK